MKLASLKDPKRRDGIPLVVDKAGTKAIDVSSIVPSIREAIENWAAVKPQLDRVYADICAGKEKAAFLINPEKLASPLPRAFQWADGSAYIQHVKLVRKARNAALPETLTTVPLMYQGGSDCFLGPRDAIPQLDVSHGTDFEGEVCVITDFVPMGISPERALKKILLVLLCNDVSLRGLIPAELANGFGFFQSKPSSAFSPYAVTIDELGDAWKNGRVHLPLCTDYNGKPFGRPDAGEMHFSFGDLIAHAAKTRDLGVGTIVGSGTVSNEDPKRGGSCLAEKRTLEQIDLGAVKTPFMKPGDSVKIEMLDKAGQSIFGSILQTVKSVSPAG